MSASTCFDCRLHEVRIAELEAENERLRSLVAFEQGSSIAAAQLRAELAALKGRRCETCEASIRPYPCWILAAYRSGLGDPPSKRPFACNRWAERGD